MTKTSNSRSSNSRSSNSRSTGDRFEAKRLDAERQAGLRRLWVVLGLTAVTSAAVFVIAFINSSWFDVDEVQVVGAIRADPDLIVAASEIELGDGLLEVDLDGAVERVQLVPWIGTAAVERAWTGEVIISVVERPPSAAIPTSEGFALVDDHGRQLEIVAERPAGYLPILGIEGSGVAGEPAPETALPVIALLDALPADIEDNIAGVLVEDGHLLLELSDGGVADFGDGSDLGRKIQSLETMLARVDLRCLDTIDVRVPAAPVVTRRAPLEDLNASDGQETTQSEPSEEPDSEPRDC